MTKSQIIQWLLSGDISIQYQVHRDLLNSDKIDLRTRISKVGWGKRFISLRKDNGHWGLGFYQAKHSDQTHFEMEKPGFASRWNILRVLRVLKHFKMDGI